MEENLENRMFVLLEESWQVVKVVASIKNCPQRYRRVLLKSLRSEFLKLNDDEKENLLSSIEFIQSAFREPSEISFSDLLDGIPRHREGVK